MATHHIGRDTVNVSVNLLEQERLTLARIAVADDRSLGDTIRRLAVNGLRSANPDAAQKIEEMRRHHREQMILHLETTTESKP